MVIYSRDALKQYEMRQAFDGESRLRFFLGDVRDAERLQRAFGGIDVVVHAAALKQAPAADSYVNRHVVPSRWHEGRRVRRFRPAGRLGCW